MRWVASMLLTLGACNLGDDGTQICEFDRCGSEQTGAGLPSGGEALLEKLSLSPALAGGEAAFAVRFHAFQIGGFFDDFRYPGPGWCLEFEDPAIDYPVYDIPDGARYVNWGDEIRLDGLAVPRQLAPADGLVDNRPSPTRVHREGSWIYGGPGWQETALDPLTVGGDADHWLDLPDGRIAFQLPPTTQLPLGIGAQEIEIPEVGSDGWVIDWSAPPAGTLHWLQFEAAPQPGDLGPTPLFRCAASELADDGFVLPIEVLDLLPLTGIVRAETHTLLQVALEDGDGVRRRFDVEAVVGGASTYTRAIAGN